MITPGDQTDVCRGDCDHAVRRGIHPECLMHIIRGERSTSMLYTIAVILLVLWLLGLVSGQSLGAFVHLLLVIAIVLFLVGLVSGRRVV